MNNREPLPRWIGIIIAIFIFFMMTMCIFSMFFDIPSKSWNSTHSSFFNNDYSNEEYIDSLQHDVNELTNEVNDLKNEVKVLQENNQ